MKFLIASKSFNKYKDKWLSFAQKYSNVDFVFINDSGNDEFVLRNELNLSNLICINNKNNIGKVKSFLNYFFDNNINDWIFMCDDKDEILDFDSFLEFTKKQMDINCVYVADNLSNFKKVIGNKFNNCISLKEFYFINGKIGDKFIFLHSKHILDKKEWYQFFLKLNNKIYETALLAPYYDLRAIRINPIIEHHYQKDGTSFNNLEVKANNYEYFIWEAHFVLKQKPCLKVIISKLFILWYLRHHEINLNKLNRYNQFLYLFFKTFKLFPIIQKIYLFHLKKLIN